MRKRKSETIDARSARHIIVPKQILYFYKSAKVGHFASPYGPYISFVDFRTNVYDKKKDMFT